MKISSSILVIYLIVIFILVACKKEQEKSNVLEISISGPTKLAVDKNYYASDTLYKYSASITCNSDSLFIPVLNDSFRIQPGSITYLKVINDSIIPSVGIADYLSLKDYKMEAGQTQLFYFTKYYNFPDYDTVMFGFSYHKDTSIIDLKWKSFLVVCDLENDTIKSTVRVEFSDE